MAPTDPLTREPLTAEAEEALRLRHRAEDGLYPERTVDQLLATIDTARAAAVEWRSRLDNAELTLRQARSEIHLAYGRIQLLTNAIRNITDNWEHGDLAAAVREAAELIGDGR